VAKGGQQRKLRGVLRQSQKVWEQKSQRRAMAARTRRLGNSSNEGWGQSRELYLQGASSATDIASRRTQHDEMVHRGPAGFKKHSSSDSLSSDQARYETSYGTSQTGYGTGGTGYTASQGDYAAGQNEVFSGRLGRVQSMESGIAYQHQTSWSGQLSVYGGGPAMARASSHNSLQHSVRTFSGSMDNFATSQHSLLPRRRAGSVARVDGGDELSQQMVLLEEKVALLARQLLHERQDMFKQMMRKRKGWDRVYVVGAWWGRCCEGVAGWLGFVCCCHRTLAVRERNRERARSHNIIINLMCVCE